MVESYIVEEVIEVNDLNEDNKTADVILEGSLIDTAPLHSKNPPDCSELFQEYFFNNKIFKNKYNNI